jgi:hypothetical protein
VFAPGKAGRGAGITGSLGYQFASKNISADLVGALPLDKIEKIQSGVSRFLAN